MADNLEVLELPPEAACAGSSSNNKKKVSISLPDDDKRKSSKAASTTSHALADGSSSGDGHSNDAGENHVHVPTTPLGKTLHTMQKYSIPLLAGIVVALVWCNADIESYNKVLGTGYDAQSLTGDWTIMDHRITTHFVINDIFMVFFFGIAAKEVTESCLPGGSLNPPKKAFAPLVATIGGVTGPISVYVLLCALFWSAGAFDGYTMEVPVPVVAANSSSSGRMMGEVAAAGALFAEDTHMRALAASGSASVATTLVPLDLATVIGGWGVPTATDISLAWMVAVQVFPFHHPAIDFLLLLAVADDAVGLIIIATAYPDPSHPFKAEYLLFVLGGILISFAFRRFVHVQHWWPYVVFGGIPCWYGLIGAALHPALALCFVVPFMPSTPPSSNPKQLPTLQTFEHELKLVIDLGLFFFTAANAGVQLKFVGPLTWIVVGALVLGKILGVVILVLLADAVHCAPLNTAIKKKDVLMVGSMASIGLTVALFVSGEAFQDEKLQGESKLGALLSGGMGLICIGVSKLTAGPHLAELSQSANPKRTKLAPEAYDSQLHQKHLIRASEAAFPIPAAIAEKPKLFEVDHMRAKANWSRAKGGTVKKTLSLKQLVKVRGVARRARVGFGVAHAWHPSAVARVASVPTHARPRLASPRVCLARVCGVRAYALSDAHSDGVRLLSCCRCRQRCRSRSKRQPRRRRSSPPSGRPARERPSRLPAPPPTPTTHSVARRALDAAACSPEATWVRMALPGCDPVARAWARGVCTRW